VGVAPKREPVLHDYLRRHRRENVGLSVGAVVELWNRAGTESISRLWTGAIMPEIPRNKDSESGAPPQQSRAWRELDLVAAEAELRLRLPHLKATLQGLEKAKVVSQKTLEYKFSI
jgi:hypothetical protein